MSNVISSFWTGLNRGTRVAVIGAGVLCISLVAWGLFVSLHEEYGVLFSELSPSDAAAIVGQLKQQKVPYRLGNNGATISVPAAQVHDIRLGLMASDLPLSGGVGFEIFDKQGLGTTEHSQKVSYQRALQGELARTIGTLDDVKQVRVHLVMPESTLFSRDRQEASAAVTLAMRPGSELQRQQIVGVQRLVAASVPGLAPARVVITDQRGVTLSALDAAGVGTGASEARLQVKREVEEYVTHKIAHLLDSAYGPGQAIVSVDALLNFDATKTTIQDLLPAGNAAAPGEGRVVRRRQVIGASGGDPVWASAADGIPATRQPGSSSEVEYEFGKRIDEVIAAPGAITRLSVGVIVPGSADDEKRRRIGDLIRMAAGINEARGDAISVQALDQLNVAEEHQSDAAAVPSPQVERGGNHAAPVPMPGILKQWLPAGGAVACLVVLALIGVLAMRGRREVSLSPAERQRILEEIQRSLGEDKLAGGRVRS